jgi:hypothetical protein
MSKSKSIIFFILHNKIKLILIIAGIEINFILFWRIKNKIDFDFSINQNHFYF